MSTNSTKNRLSGWEDQQRPAGSDSYNPGDRDWAQKVGQGLHNMETRPSVDEEAAVRRAKSILNNTDVREAEETPAAQARTSLQTNRKPTRNRWNQVKQVLSGKNLRRNSSVGFLMLMLLGGGTFLVSLSSLSLSVIHIGEIFTKGLNDQLHSVEERSTVLLRTKLKETTKGSCTFVKIACRFSSMSDRQVEKFKKVGVEIKTTPKSERKWFNQGRGQILEINFIDDNGVTVIKDPANLRKELMNNVPFRAAMMRGYNPLFASVGDKTALSVMKRLKTSKRLTATGANDEERQKNVNAAVSGIEDSGAKTVIKTTDKDGKEVYTDSDGNPLTEEQVKEAEQQAARGENYIKSGGMKSVLSSAVKGASIVGYMDSACTVYNSFRFVSALAKVKKQEQAVRFAMAMVLTPGSSIKAGDANPDDVAFVGNNLMATMPNSKVLDESKLTSPGSANQPAVIDDPDANKTAFDSPGYQLAADNVTPPINLRASQFMLGGGSVSLLDGVLGSVATIVNGGDPSPKAVSQKCRYIQNPAVRFTGLAIGIIAGIGSFGLTTALGIGGSMAIALALPYIESQAADIIAGNVFQNLSGINTGDAGYVGAAGLFGSIAAKRALKPLNKEEGLKQLATNKVAYEEYAETQRYIARATPFDINNQFSFLGSFASTLVPIVQRSKSSASVAMMNIASIIPTAFGSLTKSAKAVGTDYFDHCNDPGYKSIGIAAGPFCEVRYGLSDEDLAIDPIDNALWMANNGEIDPNSETGDAKDNGQDWNYVKFLSQCVNRTVGWGEDQDENEGDGSNCLDPAKEEKNKHYRIYTLDLTVDQSMDGDDTDAAPETDYDDGQETTPASDGWAFPTVASDTIIKGFRTSQDPNHMGLAIAGKNDTETYGQPIFAAYDGVVVAAGSAPGLGNRVVIEHSINGKAMTTVYARMDDSGVIRFNPGDKVKAGQEIGHIGRANNSGAKPYLYFELWQGDPNSGGIRIDPTQYLEAAKQKTGAVSA